MLDTIALDCQNLDSADCFAVWDRMLRSTSLVGYISKFSRDQFRRRFQVPPEVEEAVVLLSVDTTGDYDASGQIAIRDALRSVLPPDDKRGGGYVLIVGNHYSHKGVLDALALLRQMDSPPPVVILGIAVADSIVRASYQSGEIEDDAVDRIYRDAGVVLFPSHCEGFGLPIVHALKHEKILVGRNLPCAIEIKEKIAHSGNIHLFDTTAEMIRFACSAPKWAAEGGTAPGPVHDWADAARQLERGLANARARFQFEGLRNRLSYAQSFGGPQKIQEPGPPPKKKKARPWKRWLRLVSGLVREPRS